MNIVDREEFGKMKAEIQYIKEDVTEVKEGMNKIIAKIDCLDNKFANKWVEKAALAMYASIVAGIITLIIAIVTRVI